MRILKTYNTPLDYAPFATLAVNNTKWWRVGHQRFLYRSVNQSALMNQNASLYYNCLICEWAFPSLLVCVSLCFSVSRSTLSSLSVSLSVRPSAYLCLSLYVCLSLSIFVYLCLSLSAYLCLSISVYLSLSFCLSVYLYLYLSVCLCLSSCVPVSLSLATTLCFRWRQG